MFSCLRVWRSYLPICNGIAVIILSVFIVMLFGQIQQLQYQLDTDRQKFESLTEQVQEEQQGQIAELTEQVQDEHSLTLYQMAGTFTLFTCLLTAFHMSSHLGQYNNPLVQRKVIAILWMSPIYAVTSFLGLVLPATDAYLSVLKDFYEAYVIYNFLGFLLAVLGREGAVRILSESSHPLRPPSRWLRCFYEEPPESSPEAMARAVVTECQLLTLQFVFVRPLTSIMHFMGTALENEENTDGDWQDYLKSWRFMVAMLTNLSVFLAFTGLLKFYHAVRDNLSWLQPFSKFMSIKGIVFLTFWQGLLISILTHLHDNDGGTASFTGTPADTTMTDTGGGTNATMMDLTNSTVPSTTTDTAAAAATITTSDVQSAAERAAEIQNVLICLEMLFFAIAHYCVFPAEEWEPGYQPKSYARPGFGLNDFVSDVSHIVGRGRHRRKTEDGSLQSDSLEDGSLPSSIAAEEEDVVYRRKSSPSSQQGSTPPELSLSECYDDGDDDDRGII